MSAQHTPGQWEAYEAKHGWIVEAPGSTPSSRVTVCSVYETALTTDQPDRAPIDASLIAAAPDLLEALLGCIPALEDAGLIAGPLVKARAAIDKATN